MAKKADRGPRILSMAFVAASTAREMENAPTLAELRALYVAKGIIVPAVDAEDRGPACS